MLNSFFRGNIPKHWLQRWWYSHNPNYNPHWWVMTSTLISAIKNKRVRIWRLLFTNSFFKWVL